MERLDRIQAIRETSLALRKLKNRQELEEDRFREDSTPNDEQRYESWFHNDHPYTGGEKDAA